MIVTCPQCETKFEIPDDKYRPGRKARCSNCGNVFVLPEVDDAVASDDAASAAVAVPASAASPEVSRSEEAADAVLDDLIGDAPESDLPPPPASVDDVVSPQVKKRAGKKYSLKKMVLFLGIVCIVALLGSGGFMVYSVLFAPATASDPARAADDGTVDSLGGKSGGVDAEKEAARLAASRRLSLENVRQYTVKDNEKTGPMVVVEGSVVNNFDTPKDLVLLEITLYDDKGNALFVREQYCGVVLSLLQLRTLPQAAIEGALTNQSMIITNNTDILPGSSVAFTSVFFELPQAAYEFEVKIIGVQDSAAKK